MRLVIFLKAICTKNREKYSKSITALVLLPLLASCAGPRVTAEDVAIARYQAEAQRACWAAQAIPAYADARDAALLVLTQALTGNPCKQVNVYEARQAIAAAQNQAAGQIVGTVATAGIATAGIIAGADVLKTAVRGAGVHGDGNVAASGQAKANHDQSSRTTTTTTTTHGPGRPEGRQ